MIAGSAFRGYPRVVRFEGLSPNTWGGTGACLFVPLKYDYPGADCVLTFQSSSGKRGKVMAVQIATASNHVDSEKKFFEMWKTWSTIMRCQIIEWVFLRVVGNAAGKLGTQYVQEVTKTLRGKELLAVPGYQRMYASVEEVYPEIEDELEDVKKN